MGFWRKIKPCYDRIGHDSWLKKIGIGFYFWIDRYLPKKKTIGWKIFGEPQIITLNVPELLCGSDLLWDTIAICDILTVDILKEIRAKVEEKIQKTILAEDRHLVTVFFCPRSEDGKDGIYTNPCEQYDRITWVYSRKKYMIPSQWIEFDKFIKRFE